MIQTLIKNAFSQTEMSAYDDCPYAETMASYLDKTLGGKELELVESHLVRCDACLDQVLLCSTAPQPIASPEKSPTPAVDLIIRFLRQTVEIIKGLGEIEILPTPAALAVRSSGNDCGAPRSLRFKKKFNGLSVEVEIEKTNNDKAEIRVEPSMGDKLIENARITLLRGGRELASEISRSGSVLFEEVEIKDHEIRLTRQGQTIGEIALAMENAP